ncbi:MAG: phosphoadenosine phosphosulfate reductase family protein [Methanomassiliicoccales archaeon]
MTNSVNKKKAARKAFKHGKITFKWCRNCATLILGEKCSVCGNTGRTFSVTMPGDLRPCLDEGNLIIKRLFEKHFDIPNPFNGLQILLNKIPGIDRADEIIVDGWLIGTISFDPIIDDFRLELKVDGARALVDVAKSGIIEIRPPGGHMKGKTISGKFVERVHGKFDVNDPVIVVAGDYICAGIARASSNRIFDAEKGVGIRDVGKGRVVFSKKKTCWSKFIQANIDHFKYLESKAVSDVKSYLRNNSNIPVTLSFSGGKDSLACYEIMRRTSIDFSLLFVNTGLEFPETVKYVRCFAEKCGLKLLVADAKDEFWKNVDFFGPPAKDFRWCCKVCKLAPLTSLIESHFPNGTITIEGNRIFESFARARIAFVDANPFVPNQIILNPIREWRAIEVWGYIWWRHLDYNPLYEKDYERIGCYLCPACLASEWKITRELHPDLTRSWEKYLMHWASRFGLPMEFVRYGFWRWKILPSKMKKFAAVVNLPVSHTRSDGIQMKMAPGASPCISGGYTIEGVLNIPRRRNFSKIAELLKTIGSVRYSDEYQIVMVRNKIGNAKVFGGGQIVSTASCPTDAKRLFEATTKALLRSQLCTECGVCVRSCGMKAITLDDGPLISDEKCTRCGKCSDVCVVAHYYDKLVS